MTLKQELLGSAAELMPLTELPQELRKFADPADTAALKGLRYQKLWSDCCDGTIPSAEKVGGRWFVRRGRVPEIAEALGLKAPAAAKPARAKRASSPSNTEAATAV